MTEATGVRKIAEEPQGKPSGFWEQWYGKTIVIQTKGRTIITGTLKEFRNTFLFLENTTVKGVKRVAHPPMVMVDRNFISHFHEECPLEDAAAESSS